LKYLTAGIVGIDLAGDEARHPARDFKKHFRTARETGLFRTAHAGEFAGAGSVRETIELLHPDRLGHAVHAADDPQVMDMIEKAGIAIECCPTSNYLTCSVRVLREHPLPEFLRNGILATLNTDDPSLMGELVLDDEYRIAKEKIGLSPAELEIVQRNGIQAAFLSSEEKTRILKKCQHRI
jgi:adenosine deaminase